MVELEWGIKNKSQNNSWQGNLSGEIVRSLNEKKKMGEFFRIT